MLNLHFHCYFEIFFSTSIYCVHSVVDFFFVLEYFCHWTVAFSIYSFDHLKRFGFKHKYFTRCQLWVRIFNLPFSFSLLNIWLSVYQHYFPDNLAMIFVWKFFAKLCKFLFAQEKAKCNQRHTNKNTIWTLCKSNFALLSSYHSSHVLYFFCIDISDYFGSMLVIERRNR